MALPGVEFRTSTSRPAAGIPTDTGAWLVAGLTERGPTTRAEVVTGLPQFERVYGGRVGYGTLHASADAFFREGGQRLVVGRVVGPAATAAQATLTDTNSDPSLTVSASSPGAWGAGLAVEVAADGVDGYRLVVTEGGREVERSPRLETADDAEGWASQYVSVEAAGDEPPAVAAAVALAGGDDDRGNIDDDAWAGALDLFGPEYGPGQVSAPGNATAAAWTALAAHAIARNRVAYLDVEDGDADAQATAAGAFTPPYVEDGIPRWMFFADWVRVPTQARGATRLVPPSAFAAGVTARVDSLLSAGDPPAGENGTARYALGLARDRTEADYEALHAAQVNAVRDIAGDLRLYDFQTPASRDGLWWQGTAVRMRMAIEAEGRAVGERFVLRKVDGQGRTLSEFGGMLTAMLETHWRDGNLYGDTAAEAFAVDVGPAVNPPEQLEEGVVRAVITAKLAPYAERVVIELVRVGLTETI